MPKKYEALATVIAHESELRGLLFDRGGSFGFRGHRYEIVTPVPGRGRPFLRVAMGARDGPSFRGIVELMRELAQFDCMADLRSTYASALGAVH